jgi:Cdc6-like AAA superfamily ATPase
MLLIKNIETEHNEVDPWADDVLNREAVAQKLTKILNTVTQPFVVSLDSPFGTGKSFFIKRWAQQLKNDDANVVYFNAWETDYAQDPFMAFLATLDDNFFKGSPIKKDAENAKKAGKALLKSMAFNILETATVGIVKAGDWEEAEAAAETLQLKRYEEYKSTQNSINKFKETLFNYGEKLREADKQKRPIIIFVDELDRCRPTYGSL